MFGRRREEDGAIATESTPTDVAEGSRRGWVSRVAKFIIAVCLVVGAVIAGLAYHEFSGATVEATRQLEYSDALHETLEDLVLCSSGIVDVTIAGDVDITSVGTQELPVTLSVGPLRRTEVVEVEVVDTQAPEITLASDSVAIELGEDLESSSLVREVTDPVDGRLTELEREPKPRQGEVGRADVYDEGFYVLEGTDDLGEAGTHDVCVRAWDSHGNESERHVEVVVTDPLEGVTLKQSTEVLEYSNKTLDPVTLVTCDMDDVEITAERIDLSKVGDAKVKFTLTKGASTKTEELTFEVRDTKKPTIEVTSDTVKISKDQPFDLYTIVKSASDPVDGELARIGKQGEGEGYYSVEGTFDNAVPGTYFLTARAQDRNGNHTEKEVRLEVTEPAPVVKTTTPPTPTPAATPTQAPTSTQPSTTSAVRDYVLNTNTHNFHVPTCRYVSTIHEENYAEAHATREEVIAQGYSPCGHCKP